MNQKLGAGVGAVVLAAGITAAVLLGTGPTSVPVGADLQAYINAASTGDTLQLANATYTGNFTENKGLTIIGPAVLKGAIHATPTLRYPPGTPPAVLKNLEITTANTGQIYAIVEYGSGGADQNTLDKQPQGLTMDGVWVHGQTTQEVQRCIAANGRNFKFINSRATDCHGRGYDSQAIAVWNGSGPFVITDSVLEGAGENVMFGGSPPSIPNLVHTGIEFRRNKVSKPLSWRGVWSVKNLFELKNARNVIIDGNVFEGNWTDAQAGRGIVFTPRPSDSGPAAVVEDVQFTNNVVRQTGSGMLILGMDEVPQPQVTTLRRVRIANNLILVDGPQFGSNGACWTVINATEDVTIERNTCIQTQHIVVADYAPNKRFTFTNNIVRHNDYGIFGSGSGIGNLSIAQYFPGSTITGNVIIKEFNTPSNVESLYPVGNSYVASTGMAVGTDFRSLIVGKGADVDAIQAAQGGATPSPSVTATPTQTPTPAPLPSPTLAPTVAPTTTPTPQPSPCPMTAWPSSASGQNQKMEQQRALGCYPVRRPNSGQGMEYARP